MDRRGNGRDRNGRWKKGFCPNPNGRRRKQPKISDSDVGFFKQCMVEVSITGKKRLLTRHELLLHSMFEQALKGKVSIMRKLFDRFEDVDMTMVKAADMVRERREALLEKYYESGKFDLKEGEAVLELQNLLNYGRKAKPPRKPRRKADTAPPTWRKGPKPQAVLDLEKEWEAAEAAEKAERAARRRKSETPDEPEDN